MEKLIESHWNVMCHSARSSAEQLGTGCCEELAALMRQESEQFCNHGLPADRSALQSAYTRRMSLSGRLSAMKRADDFIQLHPELKDRILKELQRLCGDEFADDGDSFLEFQRRNLELTELIEGLCVGTLQ